MELKVKEITTKCVLTDTGIVTDVHTLAMMGVSRDGGLSAKLIFKSEDPKLISEKVRMVHGTKMDINLSDVNHTLDAFESDENTDKAAHAARLEAARCRAKTTTSLTTEHINKVFTRLGTLSPPWDRKSQVGARLGTFPLFL